MASQGAQKGGGSSQGWQFSIGGIPLQPFEVPETFDIGHELNLAVHKYIASDGTPTIKTQSLGSFYIPTTWKGTFFYATALQRALQFDQLMLAGKPVPWVYGPLTYTVVIKKFAITVRHQLQMDYTIELQVIDDSNAQSVGVDYSVPFDTELQSQYTNASVAVSNLLLYQAQQSNRTTAIANGTAPTSIPTTAVPVSIGQANTFFTDLIQAAFPISQQNYATIQQVVNAANTLLSVLQPYLLTLENTATSEGDLAALVATLAAVNNLTLVVANLSQLLGVSPTAIVVPNFTGSLFGLATQYYPQTAVDQAVILIAQANSLPDFFVYVPTNITLPPLFQ